ncbi:CheR family methyltransferase [Mucilaginibacter sp.]|uniref:CheR family methyltransferase n=1 Tax=Mucilaginibacter sp. TaxID=1882438 RepID=UPI0035BC59F1
MKHIEEQLADSSFQPQFPVIGIGASAGGLEAIKLFIQALPEKSGMAYIFIQHLSPTHTSILPELLEKLSPIPVILITDGLVIEPDHLYITPKNVIVKTLDGKLRLQSLEQQHKKIQTIDALFTSLGVVYQSYSVGIVLSGALNDGTLGLQVIKSYGGVTFAKDELSAAFEGMPRSAVLSGVVDFVLPPDEIARHLISINDPFNSGLDKVVGKVQEMEDQDVFKQILTVLRVRRGVDFLYYKSSTLKRRIIRRMALNKIDKPADYLYRLRENKAEQDALYNDMLISVTHFFRDPQVFSTLCSDLFPSLISQKQAGNEPLRIWIAGCATGEEAYSMAICLLEYLGDKASTMKLQIFATDISEQAITKARTGLYRQNNLEGLNASQVSQFFTKVDGHYQVAKSIRDICVFASHNLLKDPPFSHIDLISCRNVLIYLEPVLQKRALSTFHYSLNETGYLLLGKSESIGTLSDIYGSYRPAEKIYLRKGPPGRFMNVTSVSKEQSFRDIDHGKKGGEARRDIYKVADDIMLAKFVPPGVLVNDKFDIVQFRGAMENWLGQSQGKPSFNILKIARNGLGFELRNLLQQAKKTNQPARKYGIFYEHNDLRHFLNIEVVPATEQEEQYYLIVFQAASSTGIEPSMFDTGSGTGHENYNEAELRVEHLERELIQSRADMRMISEEQESANEELQGANEELLSSSEELQSLNEELETSREELQSTNEEIIVINNELVDRNDQLNLARLYSESIIDTIRDPLLILDKELKILRATSGFYKQFQVTEKDTEGLYLYELGDKQWDIPALRKLLDDILPKHKEIKDFEVNHDFPVIGSRTMLLNARQLDLNNQQIILAIEDVTAKRSAESLTKEKAAAALEKSLRLQRAMDASGIGSWHYTSQKRMMEFDDQSIALLEIEPGTIFPDEKINTLLGTKNNPFEFSLNQSANDIVKIDFIGASGMNFRLQGQASRNGENTEAYGTVMKLT